MKHLACLPIALALLISISPAARADLASDIQAILDNKLLKKANVAVEIVALPAEPSEIRPLVRHNADEPLMPASNMKLVTTSAALDQLGRDFKFRTLLVMRGQDLILVGDGDPTFGDGQLLKKFDWDVTTVFQTWAQQLKKHDILSIRNVLVDDSVFDEVFFHPNWDPDQYLPRFTAQISGMTLNAGGLDFFVTGSPKGVNYRTSPATAYVKVQNTCTAGSTNAVILTRPRNENAISLKGSCRGKEVPVSITVNDPALFAATVLSETLTAAGITVSGQIGRDRTARAKVVGRTPESGYTLLAVHQTPISHAITRANKDSNNLYAESLCKRIGFAASGSPGSWENGAASASAFLHKIGATGFRVDDGCGLSRENRLTAGNLARILHYNFYSSYRNEFLASLAVGGVDGTLDDRFTSAALKGRVLAKTGYISGVSALSGYVKCDGGQWFAFSILMNKLPAGANGQAKALQEKVVRSILSNASRQK